MIQARLTFGPDHSEERELLTAPKPGEAVAGPMLDGGRTWRIKAVVRNGDHANIQCETVEGPEWIHGDHELPL
jgi:hypothetical protein